MQSYHFPLNTAALCVDCGMVGNCLSRCACCGSQSIIALAPIFDKPEQPSEYDVERVLCFMEEVFKCPSD
jgi:hypothetical protein